MATLSSAVDILAYYKDGNVTTLARLDLLAALETVDYEVVLSCLKI